jgi:hypothetical protein
MKGKGLGRQRVCIVEESYEKCPSVGDEEGTKDVSSVS